MGVFNPEATDYWLLAEDLFGFPSQRWIPFLGAGVSASAAPPKPAPEPRQLDPKITKAMECLRKTVGVKEERSLFFLQSALELVLELEQRGPVPDAYTVFQNLVARSYPPSSSELTAVFRDNISAFEDVAAAVMHSLRFLAQDKFVTGAIPDPTHMVSTPVEELMHELLDRLANLSGVSVPLSVMSSHFELKHKRPSVLKTISDILRGKNQFTTTHKLIARAAAAHITAGKGHYLIITTNYDCLMEEALAASPDCLKVPYVVLHNSRRTRDFVVVRARFGNMTNAMRERFEEANNEDTAPQDWNLKIPEPEPEDGESDEAPPQQLVIVYKLHGCIHDVLECPRFRQGGTGNCDPCPHDGIVLSDEDYIASIAALARGQGIPATVGKLMRTPQILFLGYSLRDWNVRGFLRVLREKLDVNRRDPRDPDRTVVHSLTKLEHTFFEKNDIDVWLTDLNQFAPRLEWWANERGYPSY
jgi:SIR2-like protein